MNAMTAASATAMERTRFWAPLALTADEKMSVHDPIEMQRLANELQVEVSLVD